MIAGDRMIWAASASVLSIFFFILGRGKRAPDGIRKLEMLDEEGPAEEAAPSPAAGKRFVSGVVELPYRITPAGLRERIAARIVPLCGTPGVTVERLYGAGAWCTLGLPGAVLMVTGFSVKGLILAPVLAAFGLLMPRLLSARARARYLEAVRAELPETADMLYAFVLGGKNLDQAFQRAASQAADPLGPLLQRAVRELELGSTRAEAFEKLSAKCPVRELSSLLQSLLEAEKRGHSLSATLSVFSREIRLRRRDQLREAGAKAPLKMLAPLVFLILPASVLLTVGPTLLSTLMRIF
jgi:tight adherence protein C